jgi:type II secretory pathway pseudopilin PulG
MRLRRLGLALMAAAISVAATAAGAGSAYAATGEPPHHAPLSSIDECGPISIYTYCISGTGEQTVTDTPSGNQNHVVRGTITITVSYQGQTLWTETQQVQEHLVTKDDGTVVQVDRDRYSAQLTLLGTTYCWGGDFQTVDGRIKFDRPTQGC